MIGGVAVESISATVDGWFRPVTVSLKCRIKHDVLKWQLATMDSREAFHREVDKAAERVLDLDVSGYDLVVSWNMDWSDKPQPDNNLLASADAFRDALEVAFVVEKHLLHISQEWTESLIRMAVLG